MPDRMSFEEREQIQLRMGVAAVALNGILSSSPTIDPHIAAKRAVECADALALALVKAPL